jgi:hypothetical protein
LHNSGALRREIANVYLKSGLQMKFVLLRACPGHPRFGCQKDVDDRKKTWMTGTSPAMTIVFCVAGSVRSTFCVEIRADIRHPERYISPARHVRAFGVRMGSNT